MSDVNGEQYLVANAAANTFELTDSNGTNVDSTSFGTYVGSGSARKLISSISGLNHLEGETVSILADGAVQPDQTVSGGSVTLSASAATVNLGYGYHSDGQMVRLEAGARNGTALGKKRRTHLVGFLLYRSLGLKIGMDFDNLDRLTFRTSSNAMSRAPSLFSGIISESLDADYDYDNQVCWRQDQPLPSMILAVMPQLETQDR
jgi:hypothetical protein